MSFSETHELVGQARRICAEGGGSAVRISALLARQALELALGIYWVRRGFPDVAETSMRAQLLCLQEYLGEEEAAEQASHAWWALSGACHHHPYELSPLPGEISRWVEQVATTTRVLEKLGGD